MSSLSVNIAVDARGPTMRGLYLDVAFEVPPGVTVLFGPSGSGKSSTLACIAGITRPHRGRIALGDQSWFDGERGTELPIHERRVAYVFQSLALFPHMTAAENVAYGVPRDIDADARKQVVREMLAKMRVLELANRTPENFSGGEAQRVALARAFAMRPRVVLLDEPFSALDAEVKTELLREVGAELAQAGIPSILVTHQPEDASILGDRVVFLEKGRVTTTVAMSDAPFSRSSRRPGA